MRYLIDFSYAGDKFNGYQKQEGLRTVQGEIEHILTMINNNNEVRVCASGRTDAKVNAIHQMAHFDLSYKLTPYKLKGALNSYLPSDIYVNDVKVVSDNFHARYMAKSKLYEYKINIGVYNPILCTQAYQYCKPLNITKMRKAIKYFEGTHDFTTFTCAEDKRDNKIRTILKTTITKKEDIIIMSFLGSGFLKYQVRNMVGILIKIGECKLPPESILDLFDKKDRRASGITAPAEGLTLMKVNYK